MSSEIDAVMPRDKEHSYDDSSNYSVNSILFFYYTPLICYSHSLLIFFPDEI